MSDIYTAIMKAADHIESNPQDFSLLPNHIPSCGTPGCASGWIGHFLGMEDTFREYPIVGRCATSTDTVCAAIGCPPMKGANPDKGDLVHLITFLGRMDDICRDAHGSPSGWKFDSSKCASTLRLYAARFHKPAALALDPGFVAFRDQLMRQSVGS